MDGGHTMVQDYIREYTERYMEKVFYFCLKKTGDQQEAEDLASDISLSIFAQLHKGAIPERFSAWVWQIARNRYSKWADARRKRAENVSGTDIGEYEIPDGETVEESYIKSEEVARLRRELAFISADYRNVLVPYYIEDEPIRHIAEKLGVTVEAAKKRLARARKILRGGMDMAREFGSKSYNPEGVRFASSGSQPSGLPWSVMDRKIPQNILLQASGNPSTIEELAIELGVAAPYMEEEVERLVDATLLNRLNDKKYVTNFLIESKESQMEIYQVQRKGSRERSLLADRIAEDLIPKMRELGIAGDNISDMDIKWWLILYSIDFCIEQVDGFQSEWPERRKNGETWGVIGYEMTKLPEECVSGHSGCGMNNVMFWKYEISDYNMWKRAGGMGAQEAMLLGSMIKNKRPLSLLSESEMTIWKGYGGNNKFAHGGIEGRFAHEGADGTVIPDILVFDKETMKEVEQAIMSHADYEALLKNTQSAFDSTVEILKKEKNEVLRTLLPYCATMNIYDIRMMTVHDEVENGRLQTPEDPSRSTAAMWLIFG